MFNRMDFPLRITIIWTWETQEMSEVLIDTNAVYTSPDECAVLNEDQSLDAGTVLPGFVVPLRGLFSELDRQRTTPPQHQEQEHAS